MSSVIKRTKGNQYNNPQGDQKCAMHIFHVSHAVEVRGEWFLFDTFVSKSFDGKILSATNCFSFAPHFATRY